MLYLSVRNLLDLCRINILNGKVLKMDGPSAQGFLSLTGPLAPRVADCRSAAMLMKSALRDWLSVSYVTQYPVPPIFSFPLEVAKELDL